MSSAFRSLRSPFPGDALGKLAQRLGFQQTVPVAVVDGWHLPTLRRDPIELAPRGGAASCRVDEFGRIQVGGAGWVLEFTLAAGARWVATSAAERVTQTLVPPSVVETTVKSPAGPIVQRVAAGVVDGRPVAIVEIENTGDVAIAVGAAIRPLRLEGRGHIGSCAVDASGMRIDGRRVVRFETEPAEVVALVGADGDVLQRLPQPGAGSSSDEARCRSGGAQAAAVWPLPHTATLRVVVELATETAANASVPATADINRGWESHLARGMRVAVDGFEVADNLMVAARIVLTQWPSAAEAPLMALAMSELGFGADVGRLADLLERCDDDAAVLRALARWAQLTGHTFEPTGPEAADLERLLGRLARAAHVIDNGSAPFFGEAWLPGALVALGGWLHRIEQPEVADRVQQLPVEVRPICGAADRLALLGSALDRRGTWPAATRPDSAANATPATAPGDVVSGAVSAEVSTVRAAAEYVRALRAVTVADHDTSADLLVDMPPAWRGRTIDVFGVPVANGTMSFGLRWHGPRPALLWEADLAPGQPLTLRVPAIDPDFTSDDAQGETLLADPNWAP